MASVIHVALRVLRCRWTNSASGLKHTQRAFTVRHINQRSGRVAASWTIDTH